MQIPIFLTALGPWVPLDIRWSELACCSWNADSSLCPPWLRMAQSAPTPLGEHLPDSIRGSWSRAEWHSVLLMEN